jgi:hypothetical protein
MPYKVKRTLKWLKETPEDRPLYLYPGHNMRVSSTVSNGIEQTTAERWMNELLVGVTVGFFSKVSWFGLADAGISTAINTQYLHQWEGSSSRTIRQENSKTIEDEFLAPQESDRMRQFTYWQLRESWQIVKNKPDQPDDGQPFAPGEIEQYIWKTFKQVVLGSGNEVVGKLCSMDTSSGKNDVSLSTFNCPDSTNLTYMIRDITQALYNKMNWYQTNGYQPEIQNPSQVTIQQLKTTVELQPENERITLTNMIYSIDWQRTLP